MFLNWAWLGGRGGGVSWHFSLYPKAKQRKAKQSVATVSRSVLPFNFRLIGDTEPREPWKRDSKTLCNQAEPPDLALAIGFWKVPHISGGLFTCFAYMLPDPTGSIGAPKIYFILIGTIIYPVCLCVCVNINTYIHTCFTDKQSNHIKHLSLVYITQ